MKTNPLIPIVLLVGGFAAILPCNALAAAEPEVVQVEGGKVRGKAEDGLIVFKGIPFAAPPVGKLRWRPPQPVQEWEGVRDAFEFGPDPMQAAGQAPTGARASEDCLYLNVWRPADAGNTPLPVMVWIYGGGLVNGGASLYPGAGMAKQGIVFVSLNYRVSRLGFFAHPALAAESPGAPRGNYGYMDQIAALKWVRTNIAAFGGDPEKVTIAGESAGGGSVMTHLVSPLSRGLFRGAILQSPGIPGARAGAGPMRRLDSSESIAVDYAKSLGLTGDDAKVLEGLRALPGEKLVAGTDDYVLAVFGGPEIPGLAHSIVDGRLVVESPEDALRGGRQAMVPVIVGANDFDLSAGPGATKDALFARFGVLARQARELYDPKGDAPFAEVKQNLYCDFAMTEPARHLAEAMTRAGQPAYFYRFSYLPESLRGQLPGVPHAAEIPFVLNGVSQTRIFKASTADVKMAADASAYWVDFVKTGNPNGAGRPVWKAYDPATREVMNFKADGIAHGPDPLRDRLDLWRQGRERHH
jgi:para-nitrobenzyl esterase